MGAQNNSGHIFYTDSTSEFHEKCTTYSIFGSFHVPQRIVQEQENDPCSSDNEDEVVPFINLTENEDDTDDIQSADPWMNNAARLYSSITKITTLLTTNSTSYTNKNVFSEDEEVMTEDEVVVFETSIASFMTSTASQIDTLRQAVEDMDISSDEIRTHRSGIISHLISELRKIMEEFQSMQEMRHREELELFYHPLKCCFHYENVMTGSRENLAADGFSLEPDEGFLDLLERDEEEFQAMYNIKEDDEELERILQEPPPSIPNWLQQRCGEKMPTQDSRQPPVQIPTQKASNKPPALHVPKETTNAKDEIKMQANVETNESQATVLQQEQIFLKATVQNTNLDAAQKVESQMMQITSLLSQFSSLISEQQEEIQVIADSTVKSRQNVDKGREKLIQATQQRKSKRHYFAWVIFIMGVLLLFLNALFA